MKYLCLVYPDEARMDALSESEYGALFDESLAYDEALRKTGHFIGAQALRPARESSTVTVRQGKVCITDGPFAETKEQLGGFILIEAKDFEEALQIASKIPLARFGTIEVRAIQELIRSELIARRMK